MKILFAGEFQYSWYEEACAQALEELGQTVIRFSWKKYFNNLSGKVERHLVIPGPSTYLLNKKLIDTARAEQPDIILIWPAHLSDSLSFARRWGVLCGAA